MGNFFDHVGIFYPFTLRILSRRSKKPRLKIEKPAPINMSGGFRNGAFCLAKGRLSTDGVETDSKLSEAGMISAESEADRTADSEERRLEGAELGP